MNWFEFNGIFKICLRRNEWDIVWFQHLIMKNATEKEQHWLMTMNWSWWWRAHSKPESCVRNTFSGGRAFARKSERSAVRSLQFVFWIWDVFSPHVCSYFLSRHAELVEWNVSMICLVWYKNMLFNLSDEQKKCDSLNDDFIREPFRRICDEAARLPQCECCSFVAEMSCCPFARARAQRRQQSLCAARGLSDGFSSQSQWNESGFIFSYHRLIGLTGILFCSCWKLSVR